MSLLVKAGNGRIDNDGILNVANPSMTELGLKHISFGLLSLQGGEPRTIRTGSMEMAIVILGGKADIMWTGKNGECRAIVGERPDVFSGKAWAICASPGSEFTLVGNADSPRVEMAVVRSLPLEQAKSFPGAAPGVTIVDPSMIGVRQAGRDCYLRTINDISSAAEGRGLTRLIVGETFNPAGNWSSYPPHKHDQFIEDEEEEQEEVYFFRLSPKEGFGFQRVYSPERGIDYAFAVEDCDTVAIPFGYHPVAAAPGCELYYLWALAGPRRAMRPRDDQRLVDALSL